MNRFLDLIQKPAPVNGDVPPVQTAILGKEETVPDVQNASATKALIDAASASLGTTAAALESELKALSGAKLVDPAGPLSESAAPWANSNCPNENCRGRGYTDEGKTCLPCGRTYKKATTKNTSDVFATQYIENRLTWTKDGQPYSLAQEKAKLAKEKPASAAKPVAPTKVAEPQPEALRTPEPLTIRETGVKLVETKSLGQILGENAAAEAARQKETAKVTVKDSVEDRAQEMCIVGEAQDLPEARAAIRQEDAARAAREAKAEGTLSLDTDESPSFLLVIGPTPTIRDRGLTVLDLDVLFTRMAEAIRAAEKAESYYLLDTWKRRDKLAGLATKFAQDETSGYDIVIAPAGSQDLKVVIDAFRPFASIVVEAPVR